MNVNDITSVGCLDNHDGSIALTICIRGQIQPTFVTISKEELERSGGINGLNERKQDAVDFFSRYGAGRPDAETPRHHDAFTQEPLVITFTASDGDTENAVLTYDINGTEKTIEWNDLYVLYETHSNGTNGDQTPEQQLLGKITAEFWMDDDCWWVGATSTNAIAGDEVAVHAPPKVRPRN